MKIYDVKPSFAGGELSPALYARVDLAQYQIGARLIENFIVLPQGGLVNRPGTRVLGGGRTYGAVRLVPFVLGADDGLVLVFSAEDGAATGFIDVYGHSGFVTQIPNSPYRAEQLAGLRWLQSNDVLYLFHQDAPVHRLEYAAGTWRWYGDDGTVTFLHGPFRETNTDENVRIDAVETLSPLGNFYTFQTMNKDNTDRVDLFTTDMEGTLLSMEQEIKAQSGEIELHDQAPHVATLEDGTTYACFFGPYTWRTTGKWTGTIEVWKAEVNDWSGKDEADWTWHKIKTYESVSGDQENFSFSGSVEEYGTYFKFQYTGDSKPTVTWDFEGGTILRIFTIVSVGGPREATGTTENGVEGNVDLTDAWALGAFGGAFGYPKAGIFHQERLVLASTRSDPNSLWFSQPASWHNFGTSIPTKDDDSVMVTLATKQRDEIMGLASRDALLIFTSTAEWTAKAGSKTDVITPSSVVITPSSYHGGLALPPLEVGGTTLYVQKHGSTVYAIGYSLDVDGYASQDVSVLASHLFEDNPIVAWDFQQVPWSVVWCVLLDGTMATLTIQQEHKVLAWSRQELSGGDVTDVCCIPGSRQDHPFFAVKRNGAVQIERLNRRDVDPGTFKDAGTEPVVSELECLEWEAQANNTLQGRHKQVPAVTFRLWKTDGFKAGVLTEGNQAEDLAVMPGNASPGPAPGGFYSGDVRLVLPGGAARQCRLKVLHDSAGPMTLLGMFPEVSIPTEEASAPQ
jgi:hypothetical protein